MTGSGRTARLAWIAAAGILVMICAGFGISRVTPSLNVAQILNITQNSLPPDPQPTCVVTPAVFATWFHSTAGPSLNGLVDPANSITFPNNNQPPPPPATPNCPFYEWSEQMFLWLTSPAPSGLGTRVFRGNTFFDVSPPDPLNSFARTFIPHPSPAVLEVEQGQADSGSSVLEAQVTAGGSLVYYLTTVNQVYAFLATGVRGGDPLFKSPNPVPTHFPISQTDLDPIIQFAQNNHVTITDPNALAIMVKSSWVLAAGLPNLNTYITTRAWVLTYDTSNPNQWVPTGKQFVQLALTGMHVVGSVANHPEMIWATFEHVANAPRAEYRYINTSNQIKTVDPAPGMNWVFTAPNSTGPFNQQHMGLDFSHTGALGQPDIQGVNGQITPSDVKRWKAFGAAFNATPNPLVTNVPASNTEVISINKSIIDMLNFNGVTDVRSNYIMGGAEWTADQNGNGLPPDTLFQIVTGGVHGNIVGTSMLADSTIETYTQGVDNTGPLGPPLPSTPCGKEAPGDDCTCLLCHRATITTPPDFLDISHMYGQTVPITMFTPNTGYTLSSFPFNVFAFQGGFVTSLISVVPFNGFTGGVALSVVGLPPGVTAIFPHSVTTTSIPLTLMVSPETPLGVFNVEILGRSGTLTSSTMVSLAVGAQQTACNSNNLVSNGSFETGDFTGWIQGGNFGNKTEVVSGPFYAYPGAEDGQFYAVLGPVGSDGTLSQTFATTPGANYTFSFWMSSVGDHPSDFSASWNGSTLLSQSDPNTGGVWTQFTFSATGTGSDTIGFGFRDDPADMALDNVSVCRANITGKPKN